MDLIFVRSFKVDAVIGIHAQERRAPQALLFDIDLATHVPRAARSEHIADAVDYAQVCDIVRRTAVQGEFQLVETLAERLAERLLSELPVTWIRLRVGKPDAIADAALVGVEIERGTRAAHDTRRL